MRLVVWLNIAGSSCGPQIGPADGRSSERHRSPGRRRRDRSSARWCAPGVGTASGRPGRRLGDVLGERLRWSGCRARTSAPLRAISSDHADPARLPGVSQQVDRGGLLQVLAFGVADLVGVAVHRRAVGLGEPDRRRRNGRCGRGSAGSRARRPGRNPARAAMSEHRHGCPGNPASMSITPRSSATRVQFTSRCGRDGPCR